MKMSNNFILKSRLPSIEIPNKSVGEILWERLQEFDENLICFVSLIILNLNIKIYYLI
jgi:hypothetical protein